MNPKTWLRNKSKPSDDWRIAKERRQSSLGFMELIDDTTKKTVLDVSERRVDQISHLRQIGILSMAHVPKKWV